MPGSNPIYFFHEALPVSDNPAQLLELYSKRAINTGKPGVAATLGTVKVITVPYYSTVNLASDAFRDPATGLLNPIADVNVFGAAPNNGATAALGFANMTNAVSNLTRAEQVDANEVVLVTRIKAGLISLEDAVPFSVAKKVASVITMTHQPTPQDGLLYGPIGRLLSEDVMGINLTASTQSNVGALNVASRGFDLGLQGSIPYAPNDTLKWNLNYPGGGTKPGGDVYLTSDGLAMGGGNALLRNLWFRLELWGFRATGVRAA